MSNTFYGCGKENNPCKRAETCRRFIEPNDGLTTLWKMACRNGKLYMKAKIDYEHYLNVTEDHGCV